MSSIIEFESPMMLVDDGSNLVYFSNPHLLQTPAEPNIDICGNVYTTPYIFIDWDLNEIEMGFPCYEKEMYHKRMQRKRRPYYYLRKEAAHGLGVPFD